MLPLILAMALIASLATAHHVCRHVERRRLVKAERRTETLRTLSHHIGHEHSDPRYGEVTARTELEWLEATYAAPSAHVLPVRQRRRGWVA